MLVVSGFLGAVSAFLLLLVVCFEVAFVFSLGGMVCSLFSPCTFFESPTWRLLLLFQFFLLIKKKKKRKKLHLDNRNFSSYLFLLGALSFKIRNDVIMSLNDISSKNCHKFHFPQTQVQSTICTIGIPVIGFPGYSLHIC